jgi:hypothetical protein
MAGDEGEMVPVPSVTPSASNDTVTELVNPVARMMPETSQLPAEALTVPSVPGAMLDPERLPVG